MTQSHVTLLLEQIHYRKEESPKRGFISWLNMTTVLAAIFLKWSSWKLSLFLFCGIMMLNKTWCKQILLHCVQTQRWPRFQVPILTETCCIDRTAFLRLPSITSNLYSVCCPDCFVSNPLCSCPSAFSLPPPLTFHTWNPLITSR